MAPAIMAQSKSVSQKKEKFNTRAFKKLMRYAKKYYGLFVVAIILAIINGVLTAIGPLRISALYDQLSKLAMGGSFVLNSFIIDAVILIAIYIATFLSGYGFAFILPYISSEVTKELRSNFAIKINKLPLNYFDTTSRGDILSIVTNDVDAINKSLNTTLKEIISLFVIVIGMSIVMFIQQWILSFITIGGTLAGVVFVFAMIRISRKHFINFQNDLGAVNGRVEEVFTNHNIVDLFNAEEHEIVEFSKPNSKSRKDCILSHFLSGTTMPITHLTTFVTQACVYIAGAYLATSGYITGGVVISFLIFSKLFSNPFNNLSQSITAMQQASAASARIFALLESLEMENETNKTKVLTSPTGEVMFDKVRFSYVPGKEIIHGFSAKLKAGQKIAIVGPTGAGKTTLVNLLMRFYELDSGNINIDDVSTKDIKRENVHSCFDMILQETWLFKGSVKENLVYNNKNVSIEKVYKACEAVGLGYFIKTLPNGIDTILDETISLSEGQKQQLTIARAMIKDSPLLILDEATSSVDTRTELVIQNAMDSLSKGRTSFVIAHRLSTIKNANIIFYLENGDIKECGTHKELLAKGGKYSELYNSQFQQI